MIDFEAGEDFVMRFFLLIYVMLFAISCSKDKTSREQIVERVNELFIATDNRDWEKVEQFFDSKVLFDMTSLVGGTPTVLSPQEITSAWDKGLKSIKAIHHQSGNFIVEINGNEATVFCYATAQHFLPVKSGQNTRTFVGSYNFKLVNNGDWKINSFKFILKFIDGNLNLEKEI